MKLEQLPFDFTREQFMTLDKESLDRIPYTKYRWLCQCKGCQNGTTVRDYGLTEFNPLGMWIFLHRNSKNAERNPRDYWLGPNNYWLCGKHWRFVHKLYAIYPVDHVWRRLFDMQKAVIVPITEKIKKHGKAKNKVLENVLPTSN